MWHFKVIGVISHAFFAVAFSSSDDTSRPHIVRMISDRSGSISSSVVSSPRSSYEWNFHDIFSVEKDLIVLSIQGMHLKVYDWTLQPYICRRDIIFVGVDLCDFTVGDCVVYHKHGAACDVTNETSNCRRVMWISQDGHENEVLLKLSKARSSNFSQKNLFNINFSISDCRSTPSEQSVASQPGQSDKVNFEDDSSISNFRVTIIGLGVAVGFLSFILVVILAVWLLKRNRKLSTSRTTKLEHDGEPSYQSPQDAYSMAKPFPESYVNNPNSHYDTLVI